MTWTTVEGEVEKPHADLEGRNVRVWQNMPVALACTVITA